MGLLLAVYQRLTLRRKLDRLEYEAIRLSTQILSLERQISSVQKYKNQSESIWNKAFNNVKMSKTDYFNQQMQQAMGISDPNQKTQSVFQVSQEQQAFNSYVENCEEQMKQTIQQGEEYTLDELRNKDTALSQEKEALDQEIALVRAQYESVGKLVDQEAKDSAPKFGLGG